MRETIARWKANGQLPSDSLPASDPLQFLLDEHTPTVVSAGYKFGAEPSEVSSVLTGTATIAHLEDNAAALTSQPLPRKHSEKLRALFGRIVEYA